MNIGKYFIYKDSATLKLDSVLVTESLLEPYSTTIGRTPYNEERYTLILSKINSSGKITEWLTGIAYSGVVDSKDIYMTRDITEGGYFFRYPPCNCGNERNIPAMVVEGKTYTDVILTSDGTSYSYYWAKGVGLIKRSETNISGMKTYTLLRSN